MMAAKLSHKLILIFMVVTECLCVYDMLRMCYYHSASRFGEDAAKFRFFRMDFSLCSHYNYAYGKIDNASQTISPLAPSDELGLGGLYRQFTNGKMQRPTIKTMISIGGPNLTAHHAFLSITQDNENIDTFSRNTITFLRRYNFDGLDIDWQIPSSPVMRTRLVTLLQVLRRHFDGNRGLGKLILTLKCPGVISNSGYDVPGISQHVDYVILRSYNFSPPNPLQTSYGSPLFATSTSVNSSVREWIQNGLRVIKTIVGLTGMGRIVKLASRSNFTPGSAISSEIQRGYIYNIPSYMAYPEVCQLRQTGTKYFDTVHKMPYVVSSVLWTGYEDTESLAYKIDWMRSLGIPGIMFAGMEEDDFQGTLCGYGTYPLLKSIKWHAAPSLRTTTPRPTTTLQPRMPTPAAATATAGATTDITVTTTEPTMTTTQTTKRSSATGSTQPLDSTRAPLITTRKFLPQRSYKSDAIVTYLAYIFMLLLALCVMFVILYVLARRRIRQSSEAEYPTV